jgi:hypothetical protein
VGVCERLGFGVFSVRGMVYGASVMAKGLGFGFRVVYGIGFMADVL